MMVCAKLAWLALFMVGLCELTGGGAIAAGVHGKSQRTDGNISSWAEEIEVWRRLRR